MDNEETVTQKEYTRPVDITIDGDTITWDPLSGIIRPTSGEEATEVVRTLNKFITLSAQDGLTIVASPEGPFLPATTEDLRTVVWAVETFFQGLEISYDGDAPTMADMGLDEESNFDADGLPIVR